MFFNIVLKNLPIFCIVLTNALQRSLISTHIARILFDIYMYRGLAIFYMNKSEVYLTCRPTHLILLDTNFPTIFIGFTTYFLNLSEMYSLTFPEVLLTEFLTASKYQTTSSLRSKGCIAVHLLYYERNLIKNVIKKNPKYTTNKNLYPKKMVKSQNQSQPLSTILISTIGEPIVNSANNNCFFFR